MAHEEDQAMQMLFTIPDYVTIIITLLSFQLMQSLYAYVNDNKVVYNFYIYNIVKMK